MSRMNHDYHFGLVCLSLPAVYRGAVCGQLTPARRVPRSCTEETEETERF